MTEQKGQSIQYSAPLDLPDPEQERRKPIRVIDWNRCKRKITNIEYPSQTISKLYSSFIGVCVTCGINYLVVVESKTISPFIKAIYVCSSFASGMISIGLYLMERQLLKKLESDKKEIIIDMEEIESTFQDIVE